MIACSLHVPCWLPASIETDRMRWVSACLCAGYACRTPFADLPFVPKMHAICNPQHRVAFPELANKDLMHVMQRCLDRDPKTRITLQVRGGGQHWHMASQLACWLC